MKLMKSMALAGTALALGLLSLPAQAGLSISPVPGTTDNFEAETGQSIPTGVLGYVDGTLVATNAGFYSFTYGPPGLVAGATGHGDSPFINEFWVGANETVAEAAGHVFCTTIETSCGDSSSSIGQSFTLFLNAGAVPFGFQLGVTGTDQILNGQTSTAGAYLAQIGLGTTANAGPGLVAYLGLSDRPYPSVDTDFQDLTVRVATVPEPLTLSLFGAGLLGAVAMRRRRKMSA